MTTTFRLATRALVPLLMAIAGSGASAGCKPRASASQCDQLISRYAELVVTERYADASAAEIKTEKDREKTEALGDDAFKNCSSQVSQAEFECAMRTNAADAFEKCLE
jgi:hypothetical protein